MPAMQDTHVIGSLKGRRIGAPREIHAALHLAQRVILVLFHPSDHFLSNRFETLRSMLEQR